MRDAVTKATGVKHEQAAVITIDPEANYAVQPDGKWVKEGSKGYDSRSEPVKGKDLPPEAEVGTVVNSIAAGVARALRGGEVAAGGSVKDDLRDELDFTGARDLKGDSTKPAVHKVLTKHGYKPVARDPKAVGESNGLSTIYSHPQRGMAKVYHSQAGKVSAIHFR